MGLVHTFMNVHKSANYGASEWISSAWERYQVMEYVRPH